MKTIEETLIENRPKLSGSSIKTYKSILSNLFKKIYGDNEYTLPKFKDHEKFLEFLKDYPSSKRKTYLSALAVLCPDVHQYRELMNSDGQKYNSEQKNQEKTEKQKETWVDQEELSKIFDECQAEANQLYKLKKLTMTDIQKIQNYIILCLVSGKFINIRRSLDWTEMKIKDYDKETENYLEKGVFHFNIYKTSRFHNEQEVKMGTELKRIINKWVKFNEGGTYLLFDNNGKKLTPTKLTQRLNKILGKKASINILRHSFLSEKYKDMPALSDLQEEAKEMGHSLIEHLEYIKK